MENIKNILINKMRLNKVSSSSYDLYQCAKKIYILFLNDKIKKSDIKSLLQRIETQSDCLTTYRTIIVVGLTDDVFNKKELVYFNNTNIIVNLFLINPQKHVVYKDTSWTFLLGLNYRKYVKTLNTILKVNKLI